MLTLIKTSIKTRNLRRLFVLVCLFLSTGTRAFSFSGNELLFQVRKITSASQPGSPFTNALFANDTIKTAGNQNGVGLQQHRINDEKIDFQINSDITYLSLKNFTSQDALNLFIQARQKEKEATALMAKNDSLRNEYTRSSDDRKQSLAAIILKNESTTIALNNEIPQLYQRARQIENKFWQNATEEQINRFRQKIDHLKDSLRQVNMLARQKQPATPMVPDTLIIANPKVPVPEPVTAQPTGVIYKILIASAKSKLPPSTDKLIKKLSIIRQIENYKDEKGVTIYTTGNLKTWKEAMTLQEQVRQEGVKNPVVVAYKNGKRIAVNDARKITKEL